MKIVGIIPARYASTRFPGKPLVDICGKPMIQRVFEQVKKVEAFSEVFVATDDERIREVCEKNGVAVVMTRDDHPDHIARLHEVSEKIAADVYVCVNGDEPLIDPASIARVVKSLPENFSDGNVRFQGAFRALADPAETIDFAKIKLALTRGGRCVYMSRTPVPYPRGTLFITYKKYVGIECFSKAALDFFAGTPMGELERAEDIDHLRFLENGHPLFFTEIDSESISVDTPKDAEKVRKIFERSHESGSPS